MCSLETPKSASWVKDFWWIYRIFDKAEFSNFGVRV